MSQEQERAALADTTHAWLLSLRQRLAEVEEDTPEGFQERKQLVGLLMQSIWVGKRDDDGRTEIRITYRFGPPPAPEGGPTGKLSMPQLKNGSRS